MSASPIAGNQFYNGIVSEVNSTRVTAGNLFGPLNGGPSQVTFIGYSPSNFSTIGSGTQIPIMTTPDTNFTTDPTKRLIIPVNLLPIMGQIVQQGTTQLAVGTNISIGMSTTGTTLGSQSQVPIIISNVDPTNLASGTFGTPQSTSNYTRGTGPSYLTVYNAGAAQTGCKFKVAITCNAVLV